MQLVYTRFHALPSTMNVSLDSTRGVPRKRRYAHLIAGNCASVSHFPAYPHVSYGTRRQAVANMPIRSSNSEGLMTSTPKDASRFRRPCADEHRERTTMRRREMGAGNCKRSRVGADRSSGGPPTESKPIGDRGDKLIARIPSSGQIGGTTNRVLVSLPVCRWKPRAISMSRASSASVPIRLVIRASRPSRSSCTRASPAWSPPTSTWAAASATCQPGRRPRSVRQPPPASTSSHRSRRAWSRAGEVALCHQGLLPPEVNSSSNQKTSGLSGPGILPTRPSPTSSIVRVSGAVNRSKSVSSNHSRRWSAAFPAGKYKMARPVPLSSTILPRNSRLAPERSEARKSP